MEVTDELLMDRNNISWVMRRTIFPLLNEFKVQRELGAELSITLGKLDSNCKSLAGKSRHFPVGAESKRH